MIFSNQIDKYKPVSNRLAVEQSYQYQTKQENTNITQETSNKLNNLNEIFGLYVSFVRTKLKCFSDPNFRFKLKIDSAESSFSKTINIPVFGTF